MFDIFKIFAMMGIKHKSSNLNDLTFMDYYERLQLIALSLFEWENLPPSCNARFMEYTLYTHGRALFINHPEMGYLNMRCTPSGTMNVYDEPISFTANSTIMDKEFARDDCVLIRNNYLQRPTADSIMLFATRLAEAERTIDTNVKAQKTPVLIRCDEKDRMSASALYKEYDGNAPFIMGSKSMNIDGIKVFKTDAPFLADKLQNYKHQIWDEALTFLGVDNANTDKKERLITDEVESNNEVIAINAQTMLLTRLEACKAINKMYGLNVNVKFRQQEQKQEQSEQIDKKEVMDNG